MSSEEIKPPKVDGRIGRKPSAIQMEGLRKGMAILKERREANAKEKAERTKTNALLKEKGLPPIEPPIKMKKQEVLDVKPVTLEPVEVKVKVAERKPRVDKGKKKEMGTHATELKSMREAIESLKSQYATPSVIEKEVPVEKVVEKVVVKETMLTGSDLLNKIFFK